MSATLGNFDPPSLMAKEIYNLEYRIDELEQALQAAEIERDNTLLELKAIKEGEGITYQTYTDLVKWAAEGKRQVKIIIGGPVGMGYENITVNDFTLDVEQSVKAVSEINLLGRLKDKAAWYEKRAAAIRQEIELNEYRKQIDEGGEQIEHLPEVDRGQEGSPVSPEGEQGIPI